MTNIKDILLERLKLAEQNPEAFKEFYKNQSKEETKKRNFAIKCFQERINKDRKECDLKPIPFMAVYSKMNALKEIQDFRWFWVVCSKYSKTYRKERDIKGRPIRNQFSTVFFGALDCKKKR